MTSASISPVIAVDSHWAADDITRLATALSRRRLMTASFAAAVLAGLNSASAQTPIAAGAWSFLDDKGNLITADAQPTRIAADLIAAAALWDFGVHPTAVFGWDVNADDTFNVAAEDTLYVANPKVVSDLIYLTELGLEMPALDAADTEYWEFLSWEESAKYPVDLIFTTTRAPMSVDDLRAHPVFGQLPAVQAGQLVAWNDTHTISYQGLTTLLTETLTAVSAATIVAG